ncbi:MAG: hypothetical protein KGZ77_14840 [Rhodobacteraceae bacterium]|nr:hypothetical protein [Paracoccaceae bacterium]
MNLLQGSDDLACCRHRCAKAGLRVSTEDNSEIISGGLRRGGAKARQVQSEEDGDGAGCDGAGCDGAGCDGADFGQVVIGKQSGRDVFQAIAA